MEKSKGNGIRCRSEEKKVGSESHQSTDSGRLESKESDLELVDDGRIQSSVREGNPSLSESEETDLEFVSDDHSQPSSRKGNTSPTNAEV